MPNEDLLDLQKDLIEVLVGTIGAQVKAGLKNRDPEADLMHLTDEWGMSRNELIDTLVYVRLHLHNVIVQSGINQDSPDMVLAPLKMLASWLDEIPDVYDRYQEIISKSGDGGKGFVKVDMPPIIKECLHLNQQQPTQPTVQTFLKPPALV